MILLDDISSSFKINNLYKKTIRTVNQGNVVVRFDIILFKIKTLPMSKWLKDYKVSKIKSKFYLIIDKLDIRNSEKVFYKNVIEKRKYDE